MYSFAAEQNYFMLSPAELEKQMSQVGYEAVVAVDVLVHATVLVSSRMTVMKVPSLSPSVQPRLAGQPHGCGIRCAFANCHLLRDGTWVGGVQPEM